MKNGNGRAMLEALLGGAMERQTPEQVAQAADESFRRVIDGALNGCPGQEDPQHKERDEAIFTFLRTSTRRMGALPEPVQDAILRLVAFKATHAHDNVGDGLKAMMDGDILSDCLLAAGVTLRVMEEASKAGVPIRTGNYL